MSIIKESRPVLMDSETGKIRNWEKEMVRLLNDFYVPEAKQEEILRLTREESKPHDTQEMIYNRAWSRFWGWYADQ